MHRLTAPLLLIGLPLAEIAGFVVVGRQIGALATVGLVLAAAFAGIALLRFQGPGAVLRIRQAAASGRVEGEDLANGAMVMLAGLLLLIPGFITDVAGLLLFLPPLRRLIWRSFGGRITIITAGFDRAGWPGGDDGRTVDLNPDEYNRTDPAGSPWRRLRHDPER